MKHRLQGGTRWLIVVGAAIVILGAGLGTWWATRTGAAPQYRTVAVTTRFRKRLWRRSGKRGIPRFGKPRRASPLSVIRNGTATATPVTVGVSGATLTQTSSGLRPGDQAMLANLNTPLPTSNVSIRGFGGGGGIRGGDGARGAGGGG